MFCTASPDSIVTVSDPAKQDGKDIEYVVDDDGELTEIVEV